MAAPFRKPTSRKPLCSSHAIGICFFLASVAGLALLCFMYLDVRAFYTYSNSSKELLVALHKGSGAPEVKEDASPEVIQGLESRPVIGNISAVVGEEETQGALEQQEEVPAEGHETSAEINVDTVGSDAHVDDGLQSEVLGMPTGGNHSSTISTRAKFFAGCDITQGEWVYDETYPLYRSKNCPFVDGGFRCEENGRPDTDFMKYRWQPHACDLPRFNPKDMLERLRNQRLVFVGDSLGRNQWESMLCMLAEGVSNKSRIYETSGEPITKHVGSLVFRFQDYNCTVEYYRDPFLVLQTHPPLNSPENVTSVLRIDSVSWSAKLWRSGANILVLNSGHWWSAEKIFRQGSRFQVGEELTTHSPEEAFALAMKTWALWIEENINPKTAQVFFRSYAPVHFRGGAWNTGGHCHDEVKPLTTQEVEAMQTTPWTSQHVVDAFEKHLKSKRSAVEFTDITTSTHYRADGHSGLYYRDANGPEGPVPRNRQDCSHFCLPGVPDTWNEFLYASLLARAQGPWGKPLRE